MNNIITASPRSDLLFIIILLCRDMNLEIECGTCGYPTITVLRKVKSRSGESGQLSITDLSRLSHPGPVIIPDSLHSSLQSSPLSKIHIHPPGQFDSSHPSQIPHLISWSSSSFLFGSAAGTMSLFPSFPCPFNLSASQLLLSLPFLCYLMSMHLHQQPFGIHGFCRTRHSAKDIMAYSA